MMNMIMSVFTTTSSTPPSRVTEAMRDAAKAVTDAEQKMKHFIRELKSDAPAHGNASAKMCGEPCSLDTARRGMLVFQEYVKAALALLAVVPEDKRGKYLAEVTMVVQMLLEARHECLEAASSTKLTKWFADLLVEFADTPGFGGVHKLLFEKGLCTSPGNLAEHLPGLGQEQKATLRSLAVKVGATSKYECFFANFIDFLDGRA
jgi:hypothetical protein